MIYKKLKNDLLGKLFIETHMLSNIIRCKEEIVILAEAMVITICIALIIEL